VFRWCYDVLHVDCKVGRGQSDVPERHFLQLLSLSSGRQALTFNLFFHARNWAEKLPLLQILEYGVASQRLF
jgi:hypothetical protein